jgi:hypothetical protein
MKKIALFLIATILVGCASVNGYKPTINDRVEKFPATVERDLAECKVLASKSAGFVLEGISGAIAGSSGSAASGAVAGRILGGLSAGPLAAITAPLGAIAGLWWSEYESNLDYKQSFKNCLYQRGHSPL